MQRNPKYNCVENLKLFLCCDILYGLHLSLLLAYSVASFMSQHNEIFFHTYRGYRGDYFMTFRSVPFNFFNLYLKILTNALGMVEICSGPILGSKALRRYDMG